jgi:chromosome segregation ATPase
MLQKIKELMHVKELIDDISNKTNLYSQTINILKNDISALKNDISGLKSLQDGLLTTLRTDLKEIDEVKESLKKELYEFNLLKSHLQNKILEKFERELEKELRINLEKLRTEHKEYDDAKKQLETVIKKTSEISSLLNNIAEIGKNIKKEDFELTKYANQIWNADKEKLELMKKIDTLERLIAKMRQNIRR